MTPERVAGARALRVSAPVGRSEPAIVVEPGDGSPGLEMGSSGRARLSTLDGAATAIRFGSVTPTDHGSHRIEVVVDGWRFELEVEDEGRAALRERATRGRASAATSGRIEVRAMIPGRILSVAVAPGDEVAAGRQLLVVEAMKMQNEIRATRDGTVATVAVGAGSTVELGDLLLVIE